MSHPHDPQPPRNSQDTRDTSANPPQPPPFNPTQSENPYSAPAQQAIILPDDQPTESASALDGFLPTNPLAAVACYSGIIGLITCFGGLLLGPFAIVMGVLALKTWKVKESQYGKTMSTVRAWIGIVTGVIGLILGAIMLTLVLTDGFR